MKQAAPTRNAALGAPFPLVALEADADALHLPGADPWWREAWYFEFYDPATRLQWQAYQGVFPNQGTGDLTLAVFHEGRLAHQIMKMDYTLTPEPLEERLRFGPLKLEMLEPFRRWRVLCDAGELQADLQFEAIHSPYSWAESRLWMESSSLSEQRSQHFDQVGRYTGLLGLASRSLQVNALGFRDRMWGWGARRQWHNYVVLWSVFDEDFVANLSIQTLADGSSHLCGYLHQQGRRTLLKKARVSIAWHPARWKTIQSLHAELEDESGRRVSLQGRPQGVTDTSHHWLHRHDNMLFSVGEYFCHERAGYGVMNWSFLREGDKPLVMEAGR